MEDSGTELGVGLRDKVTLQNREQVRTASDRRTADWDLSYAPKNYVVLVVAQVASALFSFAGVWLATRFLGPSGYGWIVGIIAASQAIAQLTVNWTAVSVSRFGVEEFVQNGVIAKAFWTRFWTFTPNVLLVLLTSPLWLPFMSSLLKLPPQAYFLIIGNFLATSLWIHIQQALQGAKLLRLQAGLLTIERILIFAFIAVAGLGGLSSLTPYALAYILSPLIVGAIGLWQLRTLVFPIQSLDGVLLSRMLRFSLPMLPASFVGYLSTSYLDAFFITQYLSGADLAVYAVASQLSGMALQLPLLAGSVLMPLFVTLQVDDQERRAKRFVSDVVPVLTFLWGFACASAAVMGSYILPLIFGPAFRQLDSLLWPLLTAAALVAPVLMGYAPFSSSKSVTYIAMIGAVVGALVNVFLNFLLIPPLGLLGCAWATTLAYGMNTIIVVLLVHLRLEVAKTWIMWSCVPTVFGAIYASWFGVNLRALLATIVADIILILIYRKSIVAGLGILSNYRNRIWASET